MHLSPLFEVRLISSGTLGIYWPSQIEWEDGSAKIWAQFILFMVCYPRICALILHFPERFCHRLWKLSLQIERQGEKWCHKFVLFVLWGSWICALILEPLFQKEILTTRGNISPKSSDGIGSGAKNFCSICVFCFEVSVFVLSSLSLYR